jgi:hypothetical protein
MSSVLDVDSAYADESPDATLLADLFDSVLEDQFAVNQRSAARAETLAGLLWFTRTRPHVYAFTEDADAVEIAERAVVRDAAVRFGLSENTIRGLAATAETARTKLPSLWRRALDGFAAFAQVETAVSLLAVIGEGLEVTSEFDTQLADAVVRLGSAGFRSFARRVARRLSQVPLEIRHRDAAARRRVIVGPVEDGMAWLSAYLPIAEAVAAKRCLTSTAKHVAKADRQGRTRDQIRADLLSSWLRGEGTTTAVKTKVLVTVPVTMLTDEVRATVQRGRRRGVGPDLNREPFIDGTIPIDSDTAIRALLHEGSFTRVITDPVHGVVLDMDRRARTATRAQVEWLTLAYSTCAVDGCEHPAAEADIDHWLEFHGPHRGPTNLANLHPLCGNDHTLAGRSKLVYERAADGVVQMHSPAAAVPEPWNDDGGRRGDSSGVGDRGLVESDRWNLRGGTEDDPAEVRRITSALARVERAVHGDEPPF